MANILAAQAGNWFSTSTWIGGVIPGPGDNVYTNTRAITVDGNATCAMISNLAENGATAGGTLSITNGITLTAKLRPGATTLITLAGTTGFTLIGDCVVGGGSSVRSIAHGSSGTVNVIGDLYDENAGGGTAAAITTTGGGVLNITGNIYGGTSVTSNRRGLDVSSGTVNITGNIFGGSASSCWGVSVTGAGASVYITGNVIGGSGNTSAYGVNNAGTGLVDVTGIVEGGNSAAGAQNTAGATMRIVRAKGNGWGPESTSPVTAAAEGIISAAQTSLTFVEELEFGAHGQSPCSGPIRLTDKATNVVLMRRVGTTHKVLADPANVSGLVPTPANVRLGVTYANGNQTGTCAVPPREAVGAGVPVDHTTGLALLSAADVWGTPLADLTEPGSIGARLKNAATVATTGQQLADALSA